MAPSADVHPVRDNGFWLFPDGTRLPVISGGDGPLPLGAMQTEVPVEFADDTDLDALRQELIDEFDGLIDAGSTDLALLAEIAEAKKRVEAEREARAQSAAETEAAVAELIAQVHGTEDEPEVETDPADEVEEVVEAVEPELESAVAAAPPARVPARRGASAAATSPRAARPPARAATPHATLTAAAGVPRFDVGAPMTVDQAAIAFHDRAHNLPATRLGERAEKYPVLRIQEPLEFVIPKGASPIDAGAILASACDPARLAPLMAGNGLGNGLVAAGGWCAPPQNVYDMFALESTDGLVDLPTVGIDRGGTMIPDFIGLDATVGALWTWTEATDIAAEATGLIVNKALTTNVATLTTEDAHGITSGDSVRVSGVGAPFDGTWTTTAASGTTFSFAVTAGNVASVATTGGSYADLTGEATKPCLRIPCPGFTEYTLEAEGLCVTHGNLSNRAWPELTNRFIALVQAAHLHRISAAIITKLQAALTDVTVTDRTSDPFGEIMAAVEMQAEDLRSQYKMSNGAVFEAIMPMWWKAVIRAGIGRRQGTDERTVSDAQIMADFALRSVRPQFVHALDPLYQGTPNVAYRSTSRFLIFPAGSWFKGTGGEIDLGVQRDSILNASNDYTAAWSEQFYLLGRRGPAGREVIVSIDDTGVTGGP